MDTSTTIDARTKAKQTFEKFHGSQTAASKALGVAQTTVSLWLKGEVQSKKLEVGIPAYAAGIEFGHANAA